MLAAPRTRVGSRSSDLWDGHSLATATDASPAYGPARGPSTRNNPQPQSPLCAAGARAPCSLREQACHEIPCLDKPREPFNSSTLVQPKTETPSPPRCQPCQKSAELQLSLPPACNALSGPVHHHVLVAEQRGLVPRGELQVSREAAGQNLKQFVTNVVPLGTALTRVLICSADDGVSQGGAGVGHRGW